MLDCGLHVCFPGINPMVGSEVCVCVCSCIDEIAILIAILIKRLLGVYLLHKLVTCTSSSIENHYRALSNNKDQTLLIIPSECGGNNIVGLI